MALRILLADDHAMVRQGLRALLERERLDVVGEAADGEEAVRIARDVKPDIAVVDLSMPRLNGIDAGVQIREASPATRTILLTMHTENQYLLEALRAGFRGCIVKANAAGELIRAIRDVSERDGCYLSPGVSKAVVEAYLAGADMPPDPLTPRERQVLRLIVDGRSTKEVGGVLGISVKTAESHRARIMAKLDIHETAGLVRYAIRRQLVQP